MTAHLGATSGGPDAAYDAFSAWATARGLSLYEHQEEAILALYSGSHVVLATPTGSGKSLVATAAIHEALSADRVSFYTAPIKALVSEKFFDLVATFGADNVGMLTGDAAVNADAPIIACTAEVLANIALREGRAADVGLVVMDEFHFYAEPDRGWAWQVPLLELVDAQFLLMSATLGDVGWLRDDLLRRTHREVEVVADAERPVPLVFSWSLTPLPQALGEIVETGQAPVYVVHPTQAAAVEHAVSLQRSGFETRLRRSSTTGGTTTGGTSTGGTGTTTGGTGTSTGGTSAGGTSAGVASSGEMRKQIMEGFRFGAGFGKTLGRLLRVGIGVHHAGMLPKYRRLVERLAQAGALSVICGTDTLGVGINVPIRTVLFTGLAKFDGQRDRVLRIREFQQIAGRAGRAGFDTTGYVVVQAPEHVIENEAAKAKSAAKNAANAKKNSKPHLKKPPPGTVVWSEATFTKLVEGIPETLVSRMKVDNAMLINVLSREEDAFSVMRRLLTDNHEQRKQQVKLSRRALRLARSLVRSDVITRLDTPDEFGRRYVLTVDLPPDFALNQPLSHFALAAFDLLDPESATYALDVLSVVEAVLEAPRQILFAQQNIARGELVAELKADGVEYEERMAILDEVTWPQPLLDLLEPAYEIYRETHPWLSPDALNPKSIVRLMWEQGMSFTDFVKRFEIARSEGLVLRYLTDAYRTLRHTVPDAHRPPELDDLIEWLGDTVRQTDSSLLDEWEGLSDPDLVRDPGAPAAPPPRPFSSTRAFEIAIRNAMFARVEAVARDDLDALMRLERAAADRTEPPRAVGVGRSGWDDAIEAYFTEHDTLLTAGDARGPALLAIGEVATGEPVGVEEGARARIRRVRQTLLDPEGHRDWVIDAVVDCDASDESGELVLATVAMRRLDGLE